MTSLTTLLRALKATFALLSHLTALVLLAFFTLRLLANLRFLRWSRQQAAERPAQPSPRVSVLVPARNEAATITACITSLLHQEYPNIEVVVLDDNSSDGTGELLDALAQQYPQLTVIHTTDHPPAGWNGKSYACQRLAEQATGDWLLFTDADTLHTPQSVALGIAAAQMLNVALLSAMPAQQTKTWSERILVSFVVDFLPLLGLDLWALWRDKHKRAAANGQYLLVHAARYRAINGHISIQRALIDDFALAQRFRSCGYRTALVDGQQLLSCRMYHSFREVWAGFSKNLLLALSASSSSSRQERLSLWQAPLFAWGYACLFATPFVNLFTGVLPWLAALEIGWLGALRMLAHRHLHRPYSEVLTTLLAAWGVMALGLTTLLRRWRGGQIVWKGRTYNN